MHKPNHSYKTFYIILGLVIIMGDLAFSYMQHVHKQLDGDLAAMVGPSSEYNKVLKDPFGFQCIVNDTKHPGANRIFLHLSMYTYFNSVPVWLQVFLDPVQSIYASSALMKILIQLLLIYSLASIVVGKNSSTRNIILAALVITPLIHNSSIYSYINIIDPSITYAFAYALPLTLLLFTYRGSLINYIHKSNHKTYTWFTWLTIIYFPFAGPLLPPVILCSIAAYGFIHLINTRKIAFLSIPTWALIIVSLYSVYLGRFNSESLQSALPILERYQLLLTNIFPFIFQKIALPLTIGMILLNYFLLKKTNNTALTSFQNILKWTVCFSILWLILLPLGGYREYRPEIVRADTFIPITISLIFLYALSTYQLLQSSQWKNLKIYTIGIVLFSLLFTFADKAELHLNDCEKEMLYTIHSSTNDDIPLNDDCNLMQWYRIRNPKKSDLNTSIFLRWNIIDKPKKYYQIPNKN